MNRLLAAAALLALAPIARAAADPPAAPADALDVAVIAQDDAGDLHLLIPLYGSGTSGMYMPSSGSLVADALGGAIGNAIAQQQQMVMMQKGADKVLAPLVEPLGKNGMEGVVRRGIGAGLARAGFRQRAMAFTPDPREESFERMTGANTHDKWIVIGNGRGANAGVERPVAISDDLRLFRVALRLDVYGEVDRNARREQSHDVIFYSAPLPAATPGAAYAHLAADGGAGLRAGVEAAVADAVVLATADHGDPVEAQDDAVVDVINGAGAFRVPGVLKSHADGRALIWQNGSTLVSIPADVVLPALHD